MILPASLRVGNYLWDVYCLTFPVIGWGNTVGGALKASFSFGCCYTTIVFAIIPPSTSFRSFLRYSRCCWHRKGWEVLVGRTLTHFFTNWVGESQLDRGCHCCRLESPRLEHEQRSSSLVRLGERADRGGRLLPTFWCPDSAPVLSPL